MLTNIISTLENLIPYRLFLPMIRMKERISFLENQVKELLEQLSQESPSTMSMYPYLNNMVGDDKYKEF